MKSEKQAEQTQTKSGQPDIAVAQPQHGATVCSAQNRPGPESVGRRQQQDPARGGQGKTPQADRHSLPRRRLAVQNHGRDQWDARDTQKAAAKDPREAQVDGENSSMAH